MPQKTLLLLGEHITTCCMQMRAESSEKIVSASSISFRKEKNHGSKQYHFDLSWEVYQHAVAIKKVCANIEHFIQFWLVVLAVLDQSIVLIPVVINLWPFRHSMHISVMNIRKFKWYTPIWRAGMAWSFIWAGSVTTIRYVLCVWMCWKVEILVNCKLNSNVYITPARTSIKWTCAVIY